tara:strand:- start:32 stop:337 length:306 start_codon:yes stop_codon:yes gene_type:complete
MEPLGFLGQLALKLAPTLLGGLMRPGPPKPDPMAGINALAQQQLQNRQQQQATGMMAGQALGQVMPTRLPSMAQQTQTGYQEDPLERLKRELAQMQNMRMG